jgi:hypothetical protein
MERSPIVVLGFCGFGNSGKDTILSKLNENYPRYNLKRYALADYLKELAGLLLGISADEVDRLKDADPEFRQKLLDFNFKGLKQIDSNILVEKFITDFSHCPLNYIITDVRFPGEKQYLENWADANQEWSIDFKTIYIDADEEHLNFSCGMGILPSQCDHYFFNSRDASEFNENLHDLIENLGF